MSASAAVKKEVMEEVAKVTDPLTQEVRRLAERVDHLENASPKKTTSSSASGSSTK